jgi:hypothetical protein
MAGSLSQAGALPNSQSPMPDRRSLSAIRYRLDCFGAESSVKRHSAASLDSRGFKLYLPLTPLTSRPPHFVHSKV